MNRPLTHRELDWDEIQRRLADVDHADAHRDDPSINPYDWLNRKPTWRDHVDAFIADVRRDIDVALIVGSLGFIAGVFATLGSAMIVAAVVL